MSTRLELHEKLCTILKTRNVYFQPPESTKMKYPCIRYSKVGIDQKRADDMNYKNTNRYELIVIDKDPDSVIHEAILEEFQMCGFDRGYTSDNLNHYVLTLYY